MLFIDKATLSQTGDKAAGQLQKPDALKYLRLLKNGLKNVRSYRDYLDIYIYEMAEKQGFEPWEGINPQRFSRPPLSTAQPPLRKPTIITYLF
jgi:hypothetical protein